MIQARHYTPTSGRQIDLVVLHDMEAPEKPTTAENVARWFAGENAPRASAHWCHDNDSSVRCVEDRDVAWHAPGANHNGLGHELAGYARQSRAEWLDGFSSAMLERQVAPQVRRDCDRYGIPRRFVGPADLVRGVRGITIHRYVSEAFHRSTHWDTGYHFPEGEFLEMVGGATGGPAGGNVALPGEILRNGSRGDGVRDWQRLLAGAGLIPAGDVDGVFGPQTERATVEFQRRLGVTADGVVGPATRAATARLLAWLAASRPIPATPPFPGTVRQGDHGAAVKAWQHGLNARGGYGLAVDGSFGPATHHVVVHFQRRRGLTVDGIAGPATWRALYR